LHISLQLKELCEDQLLEIYRSEYVPAIRIQEGFQFARLLKPFGDATDAYEIHIGFASEPLRLKWAASMEHQHAWPMIAALCHHISDQGYEVIL